MAHPDDVRADFDFTGYDSWKSTDRVGEQADVRGGPRRLRVTCACGVSFFTVHRRTRCAECRAPIRETQGNEYLEEEPHDGDDE